MARLPLSGWAFITILFGTFDVTYQSKPEFLAAFKGIRPYIKHRFCDRWTPLPLPNLC